MKRVFHENLVAAAGERGRKAQKRGVAIELESRLKHPWDEWYPRAESGVDRDGIRCTVRPVFLPPEDRRKGRGPFMFKRDPEPPLFALEVIDAKMPTKTPPIQGTPYHISLDYVRADDARQRWRITKVTRRFMGRQVTLRGKVSGSTYELDTETCDVASDPDVQALHRYGSYSGRPIHVSL